MSSRFRAALARYRVDESGRRWLFVTYDQLSDAIGPWSRELGIVLVECPGKEMPRRSRTPR